jgi:hypothetical protein
MAAQLVASRVVLSSTELVSSFTLLTKEELTALSCSDCLYIYIHSRVKDWSRGVGGRSLCEYNELKETIAPPPPPQRGPDNTNLKQCLFDILPVQTKECRISIQISVR